MSTQLKPRPAPVGPCDGSQLCRPLPHALEAASGAGVHQTGTWYPAAKPAGLPPDLEVCRARRKIEGGLVYCRVTNAYACKYATRVDYDLICCHPKRAEIIARTEAKRN
jgi:hypothetical protein